MLVFAVLLLTCAATADRGSSLADTCSADMKAGQCRMRREFVLFGDSLTQRSFEAEGWGASLVNQYVRKIDVINRGLSGYNSRWAKHLLPGILQSRSQPPALLTIWFGANDAVLPDRLKARQYVPVTEYQSTLEGMVKIARSAGVKNILLIGPPPIDEAARIRWNQQADGMSEATSQPERTNANTCQYAKACMEAGRAQDVPVLDMFSQVPDGATPDWLQSWFNDGLHFTASGQGRVFQLVSEAISVHFPDLREEAMPDFFPHHSLVDEKDPEASLSSF